MYEVKPTSRFKRDLKYIERRGYDMHLITTVIQTLASGEPLAEKHKDHALSGVCFDSHPHRNPQRLVRIRQLQKILTRGSSYVQRIRKERGAILCRTTPLSCFSVPVWGMVQ